MIRAVSAASSATGRSAVPAQTTVDAGQERPRLALDRATAGQLVVLGVRDGGLQGAKAFAVERVTRRRPERSTSCCADGGDLRRRLALRRARPPARVAQAAVVVDLREAEVLVGQVAQLVEGGLDTEASGENGLQQEPELLVNGEYPAILWANYSIGQ